MFSKARLRASLLVVFTAAQSELLGATDKTVTVLLMADTHAALDVHPELFFSAEGKPVTRPAGGYALLASAIAQERAGAREGSLLVNVGDTLHGSAVADWTQGGCHRSCR